MIRSREKVYGNYNNNNNYNNNYNYNYNYNYNSTRISDSQMDR
jgi:hypothetical protein